MKRREEWECERAFSGFECCGIGIDVGWEMGDGRWEIGGREGLVGGGD